jgi:hypothetical protein
VRELLFITKKVSSVREPKLVGIGPFSRLLLRAR